MNPLKEPSHSLERRLLLALRQRELVLSEASKTLHDEVSQGLGALAIHLDLLAADLEKLGSPAPGRVAPMQEILGRLMDSVRALTYQMHPNPAERFGLEMALRRLVESARAGFGGRIQLECELPRPVAPALAASLYLIAALALENAVRHSGAAEIILAVRNAGEGITLEIRDNGCGFDLPHRLETPCGLGLPRMFLEAELSRLDLSIETSPGAGTICRSKEKKDVD